MTFGDLEAGDLFELKWGIFIVHEVGSGLRTVMDLLNLKTYSWQVGDVLGESPVYRNGKRIQ